MNKHIIFVLVMSLLIFSDAHSQQNRNRNKNRVQEQSQNRKRGLNELDSIVYNIEGYFNKQQEQDRMRELLEQAKQLGRQDKVEVADLNKKFHSGIRKQQGLNPNISMGGDFFIAGSTAKSDYLNTPDSYSYGNNGIFMREMELGLESALDPFTRGKTFMSITKEGISLEEAYIEILNLPFNMNLKLGIFNPEFGPLNRYHDHALPQFDRPGALVNIFGNTNFGGPGVAANFLLPRILWADASSLEIATVHSGATEAFASGSPWLLQGVGHYKNYYDLGKNSFFEFSLNTAVGKNPAGFDLDKNYLSTISSLGLVYKWMPAGRAKYRTFDWKSELFYVTYQGIDGNTTTSKGFYSSMQNKLSSRFWISGRIGYTEKIKTPDQNRWDYTLALDFWQSEFVFFRLQYQYNNRPLWIEQNLDIPSDHSVVFQIGWAMGPHRHEAY
ncbi:MAG: hypothetical protein HN352_02830 [Bacteroidetes bacterium]|jgi:hypothetical protein|nr:hypothetical protein [Bacteroidota bacterium]MBT3750032.1 hypothetical protein [Bacteroidota bacterium]MBT4399810.1 hypothetical protein [Bacteroidota bacterium]MBT4410287.1 hypothetical protein [Bacteroidota bacterium]MBT5425978.1 hypothetical protein [Bacteroidota bacterium]